MPVPVAVTASHDDGSAFAERVDHELHIKSRVVNAQNDIVEVDEQRDFEAAQTISRFQIVSVRDVKDVEGGALEWGKSLGAGSGSVEDGHARHGSEEAAGAAEGGGVQIPVPEKTLARGVQPSFAAVKAGQNAERRYRGVSLTVSRPCCRATNMELLMERRSSVLFPV